MNTNIIYEVNEDYAGIPKDWSARIIGVFDDLTLVQFVDGQGLYAMFEEKRFQVVQVTKSGWVLHVYDTLCETLDRCKAKISEHGDELDKIGNIYQIGK